MPWIEYRDSILDDEPEVCPDECIIRYMIDDQRYIEVTRTRRGIEVRTPGLGVEEMLVRPTGGNSVEVLIGKRS